MILNSIKFKFVLLTLILAVIFTNYSHQVIAAEKLMIPIGKSTSIPANGVKKILAVKEGIVEVLNVSDKEIILSGIGKEPGITQIILWDTSGRRIYNVETYSEPKLIQQKFSSILDIPSVKLIIFPDAAYLKGQVTSEEDKLQAEKIASSLIKDRKILNLIQFEVNSPSLQQRIEAAIQLPDVKVSVISSNFDPKNPTTSNSLVGTDTTNLRVVLEGKVKNQNDYIHLQETVRGFVNSFEQISNLVIIESPTQVVFQAYILQVSKNNTEDLGIEWGKSGDEGNVITGVLGFIENKSNDFRGDVQSIGAPVPKDLNPFEMNNINRFDLIAAQVQAWETSGKAKILANPKLMVYANASALKLAKAGWTNEEEDTQEEQDIEKDVGIAYVNVGQDIYYPSTIDASGNPTYTKAEAALKLSIRDLFVHKNELKFSVFAKQAEPSFTRGTNAPPDILKRSIMTTLKLKDQQTIVLGGLINRTDNVTWNKVPLLGDLPLVGRLFKSRNKSMSENELVILLTPKILSSERDLSGNKKYKEVQIPRRTDKLEKLHKIFQQIKSSHLPAEN
ncbi:MAG: pilus assembly protein N-terminal domain-containing protein [Candidatus Rifleibacteriota bacterium]